jgi:hypothetical protein
MHVVACVLSEGATSFSSLELLPLLAYLYVIVSRGGETCMQLTHGVRHQMQHVGGRILQIYEQGVL